MRGCRSSLTRLLPFPAVLLAFYSFAGPSSSLRDILQQAQDLIKQGNLSAARNQLSDALTTYPHAGGLYDLLGVVDAQQGNYRAAETSFKKAIEADPRLTGAYLNLGRLYQENSGKDSAALRKGVETYRRLLTFDPRNVEALYQSALLLELQGSFRASLEQVSRLPAGDQERAQVLSVICADSVGMGQGAQADDAASRMLQSEGLAEADVTSILPTLEVHGRSDLAVRLLEGLVKRQVAGVRSMHDLGVAYLRQGKLDQARKMLERVAESQSNSAAPLLDLAHVADQQGDHQGALGYLAHARDLDPQNAAVHFFFGMVSVEEDLLEEAYRSLKQAVILAPDNAYYNYALGMVAQQRANPNEAVPYFKKYVALRPGDPRGPLQLGVTYFEGHQDDLAEKELKEAVQHRETAAVAHFFLGRIDNQKGAYSDAFHELETALALEPNYADPYAEEGIIHMKQKAYAAAEQALRRALAIDPNHYAANLNLMMLYQRTGDKRAGQQADKFEEVKKKRAERAKLSLRSIEIVR
jgi:Tfp pilus assembly protein PilF